jgi:glycosyltransferase involved in cell wall biosynthesis
MRVLFWSLTFWPNIGGIEVLAAKLLPALRERGHEFMVVTPQTQAASPDHVQYQGIPIIRCSFQNTSTPIGIDHIVALRRKIADLKRAFAPDLIHINGVGPTDFFHQTTDHAHRAPLLVTLHGEWRPEADTIVERTLRAADWVAGCSAAVLERGRRLAPEITDHSSIIYNGLEAPSLSPEPLPFDAPRILCLGRLAPEKGMDLALTAFASIVDRYPHARLIVAGNGPLKSELQHQASACGIDHAVDFIGWLAPDKVPALINASTIVLMPSRQDSMPLVVLEASLMARPVVATRVGGLPEVVAHEETGLLVESENSQALAHAVVSLLSHPDTATRMGESARARAQTLFGWEHHVNAYDTLYQELSAVEPDLIRTSSRNRD